MLGQTRRAVPADAPALHALIQSAYRGDSARAGWTHEADLLSGERIALADLQAILADPDQAFLVIDGRDGLLGCVHVTRGPSGTGYFGLLAVSPQEQAGGLGKRLIDAAEAHARDVLGAGTMELTAIEGRDALIAYYRRRGYRLTGERRALPVPSGAPLWLLVMVKPLGEA